MSWDDKKDPRPFIGSSAYAAWHARNFDGEIKPRYCYSYRQGIWMLKGRWTKQSYAWWLKPDFHDARGHSKETVE
jgi:hypothetical protein